VSILKTSFGAKPNVLQFCPLSDFYVVNVIQRCWCSTALYTSHMCWFDLKVTWYTDAIYDARLLYY